MSNTLTKEQEKLEDKIFQRLIVRMNQPTEKVAKEMVAVVRSEVTSVLDRLEQQSHGIHGIEGTGLVIPIDAIEAERSKYND